MSLDERAKFFALQQPHLRAKVTLYPQADSPKSQPLLPGALIPCVAEKTTTPKAIDGAPILSDGPLQLGETREVDFFFGLSNEYAVSFLTQHDKFFLWEGGYFGEAEIVKIYDRS